MASIHEIAPDVFRINIYDSTIQLGFNHFLVRDDEPLLYHAGYRKFFPELHAAVTTLIDPAKLRWIAWSHFESDECGALNQWLDAALNAQPVCNFPSALLNANDFSNRRRALSTMANRSARGATGSKSVQPRTCRMAGMPACCWTKARRPCSAPTCFFSSVRRSPSLKGTCWQACRSLC
jgi:hypothetical protein